MNRKAKSLMVLKGITSVSLARKLGITPTWMSLIVNGRKESRRVQKAIADALGVDYAVLWHGRAPANEKVKRGYNAKAL